jgi:predicted Zn-dependent protease
LVTQEEVNAYADGKAVRVYTGLVRAFPDDAMLAQIVGHELGHNIERDSSRYARTGSKHRRQEAIADYIGIYLAAMAGYPIATDTEKRFGLLRRDIRYFGARGSHPTTAARDLALRKTLEEIQGKQERGEVVDLSSP